MTLIHHKKSKPTRNPQPEIIEPIYNATDKSLARLEKFFVANVGKVLTNKMLFAVAGDVVDPARRIRDLRGKGYNIASSNHLSHLRRGEYMLVNLERRPVENRAISQKTRALVLDRDGFTCQSCGAAAGSIHPVDGLPTRLAAGHWIDKSHGGSDDESNLRTLCSVCNGGASNITGVRPDSIKLLTQIRRAPRLAQLKVMETLMMKFQTEATALLQ